MLPKDFDSLFRWALTVFALLASICMVVAKAPHVSLRFVVGLNLAVAGAFFGASSYWQLSSKAPLNLLYWKGALWAGSSLLLFMASTTFIKPERILSHWLTVAPFFLIAAYSFYQERKPDGGKQLEVPVDLVHAYSRLGWKWMTPPKWDFWFCWIGLLFPATLGISLFVYHWNYPSNPWLVLLKIMGSGYFIWFVFRWVAAPRSKSKYKQLVVAKLSVRAAGLIYYSSLGLSWSSFLTIHGFASSVGWFGGAFIFTGFFESAFIRCSERNLPSGIGEIEALEGPSLGL